MATDVLDNHFLTTANNTTNKNTIENNTVNINKDTFLYFMSQAVTKKICLHERKPTMTKETEIIIKALESKYSQAQDYISTNIVKVSSPFISSPLINTYNKNSLYRHFSTQTEIFNNKAIIQKS
jgi:hypothetical protein